MTLEMVSMNRVSRALSARIWTLACILKALGSPWRVVSRGVTWSELCFGWPSGSHVGGALLKQEAETEAEAGRRERRPGLHCGGERERKGGHLRTLRCRGGIYPTPSLVHSLGDELVLVYRTNSTLETGREAGQHWGREV